MPVIAAKVDERLKSGFADAARQNGLSESDLLRRMVEQIIGNTTTPLPASTADRRGGRQVKLRLWRDELTAVELLAQAEARSVPAWIGALVRRTAMGVVPFNERELAELHRAVSALGPLGRNLNTLVRHWHQTGRSSPEAIAAAVIHEAIQALRSEVMDLADRASNRFTAPDERAVVVEVEGAT